MPLSNKIRESAFTYCWTSAAASGAATATTTTPCCCFDRKGGGYLDTIRMVTAIPQAILPSRHFLCPYLADHESSVWAACFHRPVRDGLCDFDVAERNDVLRAPSSLSARGPVHGRLRRRPYGAKHNRNRCNLDSARSPRGGNLQSYTRSLVTANLTNLGGRSKKASREWEW